MVVDSELRGGFKVTLGWARDGLLGDERCFDDETGAIV